MLHISTKRRASALAAFLILLLAAVGLAACGGSSSTTTITQTTANAAATGTSTSGSTSTGTSSTGTSTTGTAPTGRPNSAHFSAVRECLSKKGITLPQRTPGVSGGVQLPKGMTHAQFAEALKSCGAGFSGSRLGKGAKFHNPFNSPRFHAVLVRFAACLRQNGINVGEPNTSGKGPIFDTKGINTGSAQFKAASAKCRSTLLGALKSTAHPGAAG
jgi:hypothetical protein